MQDLTVSVAEILGHPGEYRDITIHRPLEGVGGALARLSDDPIDGELRIESVIEGVLVTGRIEGDAVLQCARCLVEFSDGVTLRLCELFAGPGHDAVDDDDVYRIANASIDLEPMLRDAVALNLPLNPVCNEDCKGLCAHCGKDLNDGPCACTDDDHDPRWAPLSELRARLEG